MRIRKRKPDFQQVEQDNKEVLHPDNTTSMAAEEKLTQAMAHLRCKRYSQAQVLFEQLCEMQLQLPAVYLGLARCHCINGRWPDALDCVQSALMIHEKHVVAYELRAEIHAAMGEADSAIEDFQTVLELNPENQMTHYRLAQLYLDIDELDLAARHCGWVLEHQPHLDAARLLLCEIYEASGDTAAARDELETAIEANPRNQSAFMQLGALALREQDVLLAEKTYSRLLEVNPKSVIGHNFLGYSLMALGKYQLAEQILLQALRLIKVRKLGGAFRQQRIAIALLLVEVHLKQGATDQALVEAKTLLNVVQSDKLLKLLGDIYYEKKNYRLATQQYRAFALKYPDIAGSIPEVFSLMENEDMESEEVSSTWRKCLSAIDTVDMDVEQLHGTFQ